MRMFLLCGIALESGRVDAAIGAQHEGADGMEYPSPDLKTSSQRYTIEVATRRTVTAVVPDPWQPSMTVDKETGGV